MSTHTAEQRRVGSWEFWPAWAVYAPLVPWWLLYALRYGGPTVFTASNPAISHGGVVGESKSAILKLLPKEHVAPFTFIDRANAAHRGTTLMAAAQSWGYPFILKPDIGERGTGVRLIRSATAGLTYLREHHEPLIAQRYHPGPFEAGVFYVRHPSEPRGHIFSLTLKQFPAVIGDGTRTISQLIDLDQRLSRQRAVFLNRLGADADRIPREGEQIGLAIAGNHCQGTMFMDGSAFITPALERAFDAIAHATNGFHFGRFDVRYSDPAAFAKGEGFEIIELNGVLSEATHIYDPSISFWQGQRVLRKQWKMAFAIGSTLHREGARASTLRELWQSVQAHSRRPMRMARSD